MSGDPVYICEKAEVHFFHVYLLGSYIKGFVLYVFVHLHCSLSSSITV